MLFRAHRRPAELRRAGVRRQAVGARRVADGSARRSPRCSRPTTSPRRRSRSTPRAAGSIEPRARQARETGRVGGRLPHRGGPRAPPPPRTAAARAAETTAPRRRARARATRRSRRSPQRPRRSPAEPARAAAGRGGAAEAAAEPAPRSERRPPSPGGGRRGGGGRRLGGGAAGTVVNTIRSCRCLVGIALALHSSAARRRQQHIRAAPVVVPQAPELHGRRPPDARAGACRTRIRVSRNWFAIFGVVASCRACARRAPRALRPLLTACVWADAAFDQRYVPATWRSNKFAAELWLSEGRQTTRRVPAGGGDVLYVAAILAVLLRRQAVHEPVGVAHAAQAVAAPRRTRRTSSSLTKTISRAVDDAAPGLLDADRSAWRAASSRPCDVAAAGLVQCVDAGGPPSCRGPARCSSFGPRPEASTACLPAVAAGADLDDVAAIEQLNCTVGARRVRGLANRSDASSRPLRAFARRWPGRVPVTGGESARREAKSGFAAVAAGSASLLSVRRSRRAHGY